MAKTRGSRNTKAAAASGGRTTVKQNRDKTNKAEKQKNTKSTKQESAASTTGRDDDVAKKGWNDMSHLFVKRFRDDDPKLTAGAKRDRAARPYVACAEVDPSGRAQCKLCGERIPKGQIRLGLMLECHKGYRNLCTLHQECFWRHPETRKLVSADEIFLRDIDDDQSTAIKARFQQFKKDAVPQE